MRPTIVRVPQQLPGPLTRTFNEQEESRRYRAMGDTQNKPAHFIPKRVEIMFARPAVSRGDCPGYLFHFLTGTSLSDEPTRGDPSIAKETNKRLQACMLYEDLVRYQIPERLADMRCEDPELVPTIILGTPGDSLPKNAQYDVVCSTDNPHAMAQLREGFDDQSASANRAIRGLRLEFGANPVVDPEALKDLRNGLARERHLNAIEVKTDPANTAAETVVFRAIAGNSNINQLRVDGQLAAKHRHGVTTALSNDSLENVAIRADEASCLRMVDWAGEADGADAKGAKKRSLWLDITPPFWHGAGAGKAEALATWDAAVVRLAQSGTTRSLHLPWEVFRGLSPETRKVFKAANMDVFHI